MGTTCTCMDVCTFFHKVDPNPALVVRPPWRHFFILILCIRNLVHSCLFRDYSHWALRRVDFLITIKVQDTLKFMAQIPCNKIVVI